MGLADTKSLILDAAERAFAEQGFEAVSIRRIIAAAGVNLAAVHYHFGSKEGLIEAVLKRRIEPINTRRLALLDTVEAEAQGGAPSVEAVVRALVEPMINLGPGRDEHGRYAARIYGRVITESSEALRSMLRRQFAAVIERFMGTFARALPDVPPPVLLWRVYFSIGATAHLMCDPAKLKEFSQGACDPSDAEQALGQLVAFVGAGLRAPLP